MKRITRKIALLFLVLLSLIFAVTSEAADTKTMTITLTIKETPTSSDFTFTPPANLMYDGQQKTATITSNVDGMGEITVEYYDSTGTTKLDSAPTDAGTYTVKANVAEGTKYKSANIGDDSWKFTISLNISAWVNTEGTQEKPFIIKDVAGLDLIRQYINQGNDTSGKYFTLSGDIAYTDSDVFTPIGTQEKPFKGNLDGNNHKISGINYNGNLQYVGLFGYVSGDATIENIILEGNTFSSTHDSAFAGSIAGYLQSGNIKNSATISGDVNASGNSAIAGGVVGYNAENGTLENTLSLNNSISGNSAAAIIGNNNGSATLSYFTGDSEKAIDTGNGTLVHVERGYTVSLDKEADISAIEFVFSGDVKLESVDVVQADNNKLIFGGEVYAGASVDITVSAEPKTGYELLSFTPTGGTRSGNKYTLSMPAANVTIKASGSAIVYTISYDLDGGTVSPANPTSYDVTTNTFTLTNPTKTGYTFTGWTGSADVATSKDVTIAKGSTGNRSYIANWSINQYTLTFDTDGGTEIASITQNYSTDVTVNAPTKTGYTFAGWDKNVPVKMPAENMSFKALWTANQYSVKFEANNGTGSMENQIFTYDVAANLNQNSFTRNGYSFSKWKNNADGATYSNNQSVINLASNNGAVVTLYAQWQANQYTINYDLDGGTLSEENPNSYTTESDNLKLNNPTKEGYEFEGWEIGGELSTDVTIPTGSTENLEFKAKWKAIEYILSYDLAGGTVSPDNPVKYTIESEDFKLTNPTKTSYTFIGWTGSADVATSKDVTIVKGSIGNRSYIANWLADEANKSNESNEADKVNKTAPKLSSLENKITFKRGETITNIKITVEAGENLTWTTSGDLPAGLTYQTNEKEFVISGTVSTNAEAKDYPYTIKATNTAGSDEVEITITITASGTATQEAVETTADEINSMTSEELQQTFGNTTDIVLTGEVKDLSQVLEKLETVTTVKTLDLSNVTGLTDVTLNDSNSIETLTLTGNESIKTVDVTSNTSLKTLNLSGSKVEMVDAKGCENLEEVNVEGCESLEYLDVSETKITSLNAENCKNLGTLNCSSCDINDLKIEGCEKLENLDCSYNSLPLLNARSENFANLRNLECQHQRIRTSGLQRTLNILDILFRRLLGISAADESTEDETAYLKNVEDIKAYDKNGKEIQVSFDNTTGEVTFAQEPAEIKYNYVTGFEDVKMDVTVSADSKENKNLGPSGGGCNFGFGIMIAAFICGIFKMKIKK